MNFKINNRTTGVLGALLASFFLSASTVPKGENGELIGKTVYYLTGAEPGLFGVLGDYYELAGKSFARVSDPSGRMTLLPITIGDFVLEGGKALGFGKIDASFADKFIFWNESGCDRNKKPIGIYVDKLKSPIANGATLVPLKTTKNSPKAKWALLKTSPRTIEASGSNSYTHGSGGGCRATSQTYLLQKISRAMEFFTPPSFDLSRVKKLFITSGRPTKETMNRVIGHLQAAELP